MGRHGRQRGGLPWLWKEAVREVRAWLAAREALPFKGESDVIKGGATGGVLPCQLPYISSKVVVGQNNGAFGQSRVG